MMKTKKKNKFFTFCFSLFPGAGEMYMGFMKAGVSLMLLFFLALLIPTVLRLDIFSSLAVIVWFYGFFHTNHLAVLNDEEFNQVEDNYLFGMDMLVDGRNFVTKYQKWVAIALIGAGVLLLWNTMTAIAYRLLPEIIYGIMRTIGNYVPRTLVAVVIILIGVRMIKGRKEQLAKLEEEKKGE